MKGIKWVFCFFSILLICVACSSVQPTIIAVSPIVSPTNRIPPTATSSAVSVIPSPIATTPSPILEPTEVIPTPTSTMEPEIVVTPSDSRYGVWLTKPSYQVESPSSYLGEYELAKWRLIPDRFRASLIHRTLAGCRIGPSVGTDYIDSDFQITTTQKLLGNFAYNLHAVSYKGNVISINYCFQEPSKDPVTCFRVRLQGQQQQCIQDVEAVLRTLQLLNPNPVTTPQGN